MSKKTCLKNYSVYPSPIGEIVIAADTDGLITDVTFGKVPDSATKMETPAIKEAARQLQEYFAGKRRKFELPLNPSGTQFQEDVWAALQEIPYGETRTYGQVAATVGNPKGSRAVGLANNRNPIAVIIPCHRVIGANGKLTGYAGGLDSKQHLLDLEKKHK